MSSVDAHRATLDNLIGLLLDELQRALRTIDTACLELLTQRICATAAVGCIGVGKSSFIAGKLASTLTSLGVRSKQINALDALHGDLGWLRPADVALVWSNSGETEELVDLLPRMLERGVECWVITSRANSRLARLATHLLLVPKVKELDSMDSMPTTSTTLQMAVADLISANVQHRLGVAQSAFCINHPAGRIGKRLVLQVQDLMLQGGALPTASAEEVLLQLLPRLSAGRSGCLLIVDDKHSLLGIFTDGDLRRTLERASESALQQRIGDLMNACPRVIEPTVLAVEALHKMEEQPMSPISCLPVISGGKLVGLLRLHDLIQAGI